MRVKPFRISIFEHDKVSIGDVFEGNPFCIHHLEKLHRYHGDAESSVFRLVHNGVQFQSYVGILKIGELEIEILPKADKSEDKKLWRNQLIQMLKSIKELDVFTSESSQANLSANHLLDYYFDIFLSQVEQLFRRGWIKKYRNESSNQLALKGQLKIAKHLRENLIHKERFYTRHQVYDINHVLLQILTLATKVICDLTASDALHRRARSLLLNMPDPNRVLPTQAIFDNIRYNRKTIAYEPAIKIARLILLNFHPDFKRGNEDVLSIMFNMNLLWERFVLKALRRYGPEGYEATGKENLMFWRADHFESKMEPDIILKKENKVVAIIDTKWKNAIESPSPVDLRQMYAYSGYYGGVQSALYFPGKTKRYEGHFHHFDSGIPKVTCDLLSSEPMTSISEWQEDIAKNVFSQWLTYRDDMKSA